MEAKHLAALHAVKQGRKAFSVAKHLWRLKSRLPQQKQKRAAQAVQKAQKKAIRAAEKPHRRKIRQRRIREIKGIGRVALMIRNRYF